MNTRGSPPLRSFSLHLDTILLLYINCLIVLFFFAFFTPVGAQYLYVVTFFGMAVSKEAIMISVY